MKQVNEALISTNNKVTEEEVSRKVENKPKKLGTVVQLIAAVAASISVVGVGTGGSWTSPALPYLQSNYSELPITESEGTWIASFADIGEFIGGILSTIFANLIGRRYFLLHSNILYVISWTMIIFAKNVLILYIARLIHGIAMSITIGFAIMYIGEIAEKDIRGKLILTVKIAMSIGHLIVKIAGAFLSYKYMNISMLYLALPAIFILPFVPESPYYLLLHDRRKEALKALMQLRGTTIPEFVNLELDRVKNTAKDTKENKQWAFRELFFVKGNRKSLFVVLTAMYIPFLSGKLTVAAHTQKIFSYTGIYLSPAKSTVILGIIEVMVSFIGSLIIECFSRRKLYLLYGSLTGFSLIILGFFFFLKFYLVMDVTSISWVPFAGLIMFTIGINLGTLGVAHILVGEVLALKVKATAVTCVILGNSVIIFLSKVMFELVNNTAGIYTNFWIYAGFCSVGTLLFYFIAPETKSKTLEEIQDIFHSDTKSVKRIK